VTIHFQLTFDDLIAMQKNVISHSRTHDIKGKYFKWVISSILLVALLLLLPWSVVTMIISFLVAGIFFITAPFIYPKMAFSKLKKQMERQDFSKLLKPCEMRFTKDGINRVIDGETTHFSWNDFKTYHADDSHYFLYVDDLQGVIIPKKPVVENGDKSTFQKNFIAYANSLSKGDPEKITDS